MRVDEATERMLRAAAPRALAVLVRRTGDFDASEDALQEALVAAAAQWPKAPPENPPAWLVAVAHRRYVEHVRSEVARRRREQKAFGLEAARAGVSDEASGAFGLDTGSEASGLDDSLALFVLCAHPAVARASQVALTLRALGGLTTAEIARALFVPETTIGQRISRAKARIRATGATFEPPADVSELAERVATVCTVLAVIFTEGHTASSGESLVRVDLSAEAIRLARMLRATTPADAPWRAEVDGLLALMLLTEARRPARLRSARSASGGAALPEFVPLAEQDRTLWDRALIAEGVAIVENALGTGRPGPFQVQAAIAAVHDEADSTDATDWREILGLYDLLRVVGPGPMVELGRVVALAMVHGPDAGLRALESVALEPALADHFRVHAVRAHLLERAVRPAEARTEFAAAAALARNAAERRYLEGKAAGPTG